MNNLNNLPFQTYNMFVEHILKYMHLTIHVLKTLFELKDWKQFWTYFLCNSMTDRLVLCSNVYVKTLPSIGNNIELTVEFILKFTSFSKIYYRIVVLSEKLNCIECIHFLW